MTLTWRYEDKRWQSLGRDGQGDYLAFVWLDERGHFMGRAFLNAAEVISAEYCCLCDAKADLEKALERAVKLRA